MKIFTYIFLFLIFYFHGLSSFAQEDVNQRLRQYNTATLDQKIALFHYVNLRLDNDSILYYIKDLQKQGLKQHRDDVLAMANYGMGTYLREKSLFDESENKLKNALKYYLKVGNDTMTTDTYNALGNTAFLSGDISKAEILYTKSLRYGKQSGEKKFEMLPIPNIAKIHIQQGKYEEAEKSIKEYIAFYKKTNGSLRSLAAAYGLMGQLHLERKDYDKAINDYNNSMEYGLTVGSMKTVANCYTNLGIVEYLSNNNERSEQYFRLALAYRLKDDNKFFIAEGYYNLGDFYSGLEENDSAIANYKKSAEVAKSVNNLRTQMDALSQLSVVYNSLGKKNQEIEVLKDIISLQDDINKQQNKDILHALNLSYDQSIGEFKDVGAQREGKLQNQLVKYQSIFNIWVLIAILAIVGLMGLIYLLRKRNGAIGKN